MMFFFFFNFGFIKASFLELGIGPFWSSDILTILIIAGSSNIHASFHFRRKDGFQATRGVSNDI